MLSALQQVGAIKGLPGELDFHELNLSPAGGNLGPSLKENTLPSETILFHVAGDTHFKPADVAAQRRINIEAPMELASGLKGRIGRMLHVSTAYVAGQRTGLIRENELDCGQGFWNSYEKSKFDAEVALTAFCRQQGIPLVIVRPAIIINERKSGRASTFTHLNALVEVVSRLQAYYGISDGQVVSKIIRLMADPRAQPNLAPVDSIIPALLQIAKAPTAAGKVFHLCHPEPQTNHEIMDLICEAYKVRSLIDLQFVEQLTGMSHTEEMVARSLKVYSPYLNSRLELDLSNSRSVVPDYDANFSPLDVGYLQRVIEFQRGK